MMASPEETRDRIISKLSPENQERIALGLGIIGSMAVEIEQPRPLPEPSVAVPLPHQTYGFAPIGMTL